MVLELQNIILEMIAKGDPLADTTARLCLEAEKLARSAICSVLTVDGTGLIHPLAGPSLPAEYSAALEGIKIGPTAGSCGTAAYLRSEGTVTDIEIDRSEERRVGKECVSTCRSRWSPEP